MVFDEAKATEFLRESVERIPAMKARSIVLRQLPFYETVRRRLDNICSVAFNYSSTDVHLMGSRVIGVGTDESDLDIFITLEGSFYIPFVRDAEHDRRFEKVKIQLTQWSAAFQFQYERIDARIPYMRFKHISREPGSTFYCDINITNGLGPSNCSYLREMFRLQDDAISLFHLFRELLRTQGFEHFNGYTLALLIYFYLEKKGYCPTIERVQQGLQAQLIGDMNAAMKKRELPSYNINKIFKYKNHKMNIFKFYQEHDYSKVICVFDGTLVDGDEYKRLYPDFDLKGVRIVGPINKKRNVGVVEDAVRDEFIQLMGSLSDLVSSHFNE